MDGAHLGQPLGLGLTPACHGLPEIMKKEPEKGAPEHEVRRFEDDLENWRPATRKSSAAFMDKKVWGALAALGRGETEALAFQGVSGRLSRSNHRRWLECPSEIVLVALRL